MPRLGRRSAVLALLVLLVVAVAVVQAPRTAEDPLLNYDRRSAPAFDLSDLSDPDASVTLADVSGPLVLNIWASWCVPCRREMPVLQAAHENFGDRVTFLGVNHLDQRVEAGRFLADTGVTYRSVFDPSGSVAADYGAFGLPTTYFVTDSKQIVATKTGELTPEELDEQIERLLASNR